MNCLWKTLHIMSSWKTFIVRHCNALEGNGVVIMKKYNFPKQAPFIQDRERQTDKIQERLLKTWSRCSVSVRRLCETIRTVSPGCASVPPYCMTHQANYINFLSIGFLVCKAMGPIGVGGVFACIKCLAQNLEHGGTQYAFVLFYTPSTWMGHHRGHCLLQGPSIWATPVWFCAASIWWVES